LQRCHPDYDPYVTPGSGIDFHGKPDKRAVILAVPYEPPAEAPDEEFDLWLVIRLRATAWRPPPPHDTRRKFLDHRLALVKREWARLKSNDSLECRNCHSEVAMDFTRQSTRAADIHGRYLIASDDYTCIDCHKGIAHQLPDMRGIEPGWLPPEELRNGLGTQSGLDGVQRQIFDYLQTARQTDG
jgi:hypothetical protein